VNPSEVLVVVVCVCLRYMMDEGVHVWLSYSTLSGNVHGLNFLSCKNMLGYSATRGLQEQIQSLSIFGGEGAGRAGRWNGVGGMYYSTHRLESKLIVTGNRLITVRLV